MRDSDQWVASEKTGLSNEEALRRQKQYGPNEIAKTGRHSWLHVLADMAREPMLLLLLVCGAVYVLLGDKAEAAMLLGFVAVVVGITAVQSAKAERTLDALRRLSAAQAYVLREGRQVRIPARDVVCGDVVILVEGDRVPADGVMLSGANVTIDESLLTGESVAVRKSVGASPSEEPKRPGGDDSPFVYSGTLVVQGRGTARVVAIGASTQIGKIGGALSNLSVEPARIQIETNQVVRRLAIAAVVVSVLVTAAYGYGNNDWLRAVLVGVALAMAILPEELPVVLSVFLGLGAWRIAKARVLTRYLPAIETLGAASVLCVDKTGTITENQMSVGVLYAPDGRMWAESSGGLIPDAMHQILEYAALASHRDPFDPTERAISKALHDKLANTEHVHPGWSLVREYALSRDILATTRVWSPADTHQLIVAAKGAPEAVADLCHLCAAEQESLTNAVRALAARGLRVLAVARASLAAGPVPTAQHDFNFEFLGLIGLADPIREIAPKAVTDAHAAGIRVVMVTGDYPETAMNIARQVGLHNPGAYVTGPQLSAMSAAEMAVQVRNTNIFCRVAPEQKLQLVEALKADGEIVAMTGDGVNDAPALKAADVGIAMGGRGTDVAREAAALVLMDDDLGSIVTAVALGRRIFDNLRKAISFVIAAHIPIVGMSVIPVFLGLPLLLLPIHILFLQLIIDPACSIAFEAEPSEADLMRRPPRPRGETLFSRPLAIAALLQGAVILAIVLAAFLIALQTGRDEGTARALAFCLMVLSSLVLLFLNRTSGRDLAAAARPNNTALFAIPLAALVFLATAVFVTPVRVLFGFAALLPRDFLFLGVAWAVNVTLLTLLKMYSHRAQATVVR